MRRRLLIVVIFLLAGAVVNVGVAWGCAWGCARLPHLDWTSIATANDLDWIYLGMTRGPFVREGWKDSEAKAFFDSTLVPPSDVKKGVLVGFLASPELSQGGYFSRHGIGHDFYTALFSHASYTTVLVGWPVRSVWGRQRSVTKKTGIVQVGNPIRPANPVMIPYFPIWPGFLANTLFYAALLWPLICGPFALRRLLRRFLRVRRGLRRGLCPKCAYPRGESSVCTECGTELSARARATA